MTIFSKSILTALLSCLFSSSAFALDYPLPNQPDPMWLRACPMMYFSQNSPKCELIGLANNVSSVAYSDNNGAYVQFYINKDGSIAENRHRIPYDQNWGGIGIRKFNYSYEGNLKSTTYNNQPNADFEYIDDKLSKETSYVNNYTCAYSTTNNGNASINLEGNCRTKVKAIKYLTELTLDGKLLHTDDNGAQSMNVSKAFTCTWSEDSNKASSTCNDGSFIHIVDYDFNKRPIKYDRKSIVGKDNLVLTFSYTNDQNGNWISQTVHYDEISNVGKIPTDLIRTRKIEYFK